MEGWHNYAVRFCAYRRCRCGITVAANMPCHFRTVCAAHIGNIIYWHLVHAIREALMTTTTYLGVIDGLHTWEVRDGNGTVVGMNQSADETPTVPASVSARQIRLWLVRHGISLASVDAAIDAIPDQLERDSVRVEYDYAPYVERSHPMLVPLASSLVLTEEQVDQAFREAAVI